TVATHDLAQGVLVGVLLSGIFFARKVAQIFRITSTVDADGRHRTYTVEGQVFFASAEDFAAAFDFKEVLERVTIDLTHAHMWDLSGIGALDKVVLKFRREGTEVEVIGLNEASTTLVDKLAIHDKPGALDRLMGH
ncbi:MAG: STAS domain-containing protein, partial [Rhodospirillaceae bacterium]